MKINSKCCRGFQLVTKPVLLASLTVFLTGGVATIVSSEEVKVKPIRHADKHLVEQPNQGSNISEAGGTRDSVSTTSPSVEQPNQGSNISEAGGTRDSVSTTSPSVGQTIVRLVHDVDDLKNK